MKLASIGLFVNDMEKMVKFYRDVMKIDFEWDSGGFTGVKIEGKFFFNLCDRGIMDIENSFEYTKGINGMMELCFDCDSVEEVDLEFARIVKAGATPIKYPKTFSYGLHSGFVADPEGNLIELVACIDE